MHILIFSKINQIFVKNILGKFLGSLIPLFWMSGEVCLGFKSQGGFPHLCASSPLYNGFLKFTYGMTLADFLTASMVAELYDPQNQKNS